MRVKVYMLDNILSMFLSLWTQKSYSYSIIKWDTKDQEVKEHAETYS